MQNIKLKLLYLSIVLLPVSIFVIAVIEPTSLFSFLLFFLAALLLHKLLFGFFSKDIFITYTYYSFFSILFAEFQFITYGEYYDLGANPSQIGNDDLVYSIEALEGLPFEGGESLLPYSNLLRCFSLGLSLFKELNHIDLLMVNVLAISFVPVIVSKLTNLLISQKDASSVSFLLTLLCPILLVNSIPLMRDGWTALFFIGTIYFLFSKRYLLVLGFLVGEFYLRLGSGLLLLFIVGLLYFWQFLKYIEISQTNLINGTIIAIPLLFIISFLILITGPYFVTEISEKMGGDTFFRASFVEEHIIPSTIDRGSGMAALYTAPFLVRFIGGTLFFLVAPTFSLDYLYSVHGIFWLSNFVLLFFPFMMLLYIVWFVRGNIYAIIRSDKGIVLLYMIYVFSTMILSQMSLQIRHKTMLMPLFYILVSYGIYSNAKIGKKLGLIGSFALFVSQLYYVIVKYM